MSCKTFKNKFKDLEIINILFEYSFVERHLQGMFQNKVLGNMVIAPWYVRNNDLHRDLQVNVVSSEMQRFAQKHQGRLHHHENGEAILLVGNRA